ncbi:hypothetical protein Pmar_PMAR028513 [Perkinsus marinus ATCC 50983]|uniref:Uncharacterized protein n=1 Tax=Perkinsus marinus (strain ATCC 50983 / TXsc) TaxID=423536 RepID=C5LMC2_PERM5|nr:hypothetical protein Pmar_PMAR028513 [Perkinsus marinus ATCC 50983]EER02134.1 hypothetical protein Pmar_PMAR028513 [Perkinsus marinus ATCC 50983]|eukprot:XP_002769416.1 hypothetical protein Pmar_PMAR028513 [Perkinsus marinus ATCC 50983]
MTIRQANEAMEIDQSPCARDAHGVALDPAARSRHNTSLNGPFKKVDILSHKPMRHVFYEMEHRRLERSLEGYRMEPSWGARFAAELVVVLVAFILLSNSIGSNIVGQILREKNTRALLLVVPGAVTGFFIAVALISIALRKRSAISTLAVVFLLIGVVWIIWLYNPADKWPAPSLKNIIIVSVVVASLEVLLFLIYVTIHFGYPYMLKKVHPDFLVKHWWRLHQVDEENAFGYSYQRYGIFSLTRNICNYHGDVDSEGRPHGFGVWTDDSRHGEILRGVWMRGLPMGPFVSREFSSGSVSVCRRILWASTRAEPGNECSYGVASVECSVSGYFFNHLPKVKELLTSTDDFIFVLDHFKREFESSTEELAKGEGFIGSERDACRKDCPAAPPALRLRLLTSFGALERGSSQLIALKEDETGITGTGFMELLPPETCGQDSDNKEQYYYSGRTRTFSCGQMLALGQFPLWIRPFVFSQGSGSALTYHAARDCLPEYAPDLADFVAKLRTSGFRRIHFLVHSMGARLFCEALPFMVQDSLLQIRACSYGTSNSAKSTRAGSLEGTRALSCRTGRHSISSAPGPAVVDLEAAAASTAPHSDVDRMTLLNVVLVNADYPLDKFRHTVLPSLLEYCERVTVYADSRDGALMWSELFNREKALGKFVGTLACVERDNGQSYGEAYVDVMDTTHMDQNVHQLRHNFFNLNVQVVSDIAEIVESCTPAAKRSTRLTKTGRGNVYTFLSPPSFVKNH